jgi:hypothetical protein
MFFFFQKKIVRYNTTKARRQAGAGRYTITIAKVVEGNIKKRRQGIETLPTFFVLSHFFKKSSILKIPLPSRVGGSPCGCPARNDSRIYPKRIFKKKICFSTLFFIFGLRARST